MSRFVVQQTLEHPVDRVWAFATDWNNAPQWMSGVDSMRVEGSEPVGEGTAIVFVSRGAERGSTIAAWEPPHRVALRSVQGGVTATYSYRFEALDEGRTEARLEAVCEFRGALKLVGPLIGWLVERSDGGQLRNLAEAMKAL